MDTIQRKLMALRVEENPRATSCPNQPKFTSSRKDCQMADVVWKYEHQGSIISDGGGGGGGGGGGDKRGKWLKQYSSNHRMLLVGEGDFSFSLSLGMAFGGASNIVATSFDSYDVVIKKYKAAKTNLEILHSLGAELLHEVDALQMKLHTDLQMQKFDRIVFNFPHAGFMGLEDDQQVIKIHQNLVCGFFKNASGMLLPKGEVHVAHKTSYPFQFWNIEELATRNSLALRERIKFRLKDYPGYKNKRGDGKRADEPFPLGECSTYKFIYSSNPQKPTTSHQTSPHQPQQISSQVMNAGMVMNPYLDMNSFECFWVFQEYFDHAVSTFGHADDHLIYSVPHMLEIGFERCKAQNRGDPLNDYIYNLVELQHLSKQRTSFLQNWLLEIDHQYGL